jgi:uncharacterized RDD family membrane protein YckC
MSVVYETLLLAALLFVANFALLPLVSAGHADRAHPLTVPDLPTRALLFCTLFSIAAFYFTWSWTAGRRTLPMKTWRIRMVARDGGSLTYKQAFIRYLAAWIGPVLALACYAYLRSTPLGSVALVLLALNYLAALVDPERQFLHDRIAGTRIVQDR